MKFTDLSTDIINIVFRYVATEQLQHFTINNRLRAIIIELPYIKLIADPHWLATRSTPICCLDISSIIDLNIMEPCWNLLRPIRLVINASQVSILSVLKPISVTLRKLQLSTTHIDELVRAGYQYDYYESFEFKYSELIVNFIMNHIIKGKVIIMHDTNLGCSELSNISWFSLKNLTRIKHFGNIDGYLSRHYQGNSIVKWNGLVRSIVSCTNYWEESIHHEDIFNLSIDSIATWNLGICYTVTKSMTPYVKLLNGGCSYHLPVAETIGIFYDELDQISAPMLRKLHIAASDLVSCYDIIDKLHKYPLLELVTVNLYGRFICKDQFYDGFKVHNMLNTLILERVR